MNSRESSIFKLVLMIKMADEYRKTVTDNVSSDQLIKAGITSLADLGVTISEIMKATEAMTLDLEKMGLP